jgi:hypothetical protein
MITKEACIALLTGMGLTVGGQQAYKVATKPKAKPVATASASKPTPVAKRTAPAATAKASGPQCPPTIATIQACPQGSLGTSVNLQPFELPQIAAPDHSVQLVALPGGGGIVFIPGGGSVSPGVVPESDTWAMMIVGFGLVGSSMRRNYGKPRPKPKPKPKPKPGGR